VPYVTLNEEQLAAKITELETKLAEIDERLSSVEAAIVEMPDDVKQKLKDVLTWIVENL